MKNVRGGCYVYFQHYVAGGHCEKLYVGKKDEKVEKLMRDHAEDKADTREMRRILRRLSAQVSAGTEVPADKPTMRIIRDVSDAGVFRAGGVLLGVHAFRAIGMMLGVVWSDVMAGQDTNKSTQQSISVAVPMIKTDTPRTLDSLTMGFFPVPALDRKHPSTTFTVRGTRIRLDLFTPGTRGSSAPIPIPRFKCVALPSNYLSYLIASPDRAVLVDAEPVLGNIPQPVRYAFYNLLVSQDRPHSAETIENLRQAHQILSLVTAVRPHDIGQAWRHLVRRRPKWRSPVERGIARLRQLFGELNLGDLLDDT
jgi:hypothetical protein